MNNLKKFDELIKETKEFLENKKQFSIHFASDKDRRK